MKVSLITIVNNEIVFDDFKENLKTQKEVDYELIPIDNKKNQYNSARIALDIGAQKAQGDYLIFLHPDIRFLDDLALKSIVGYVRKINDFGVIGVAGCPVTKGKSQILTTIVQGKNRDKVGSDLKDITRVQTVDECFFIEKNTYYKNNRFSKDSGWHLYAVEQCLEALLNGKNNYIIPAHLWHISPGDSENINYVYSGIRLINKYGDKFESVNTTVEKWYSKGVRKYYMPWLNFLLHKIKRKLRKNTNLYKKIQKIYLKYER